jgi:hypothetical protein
MRIGAIVLAAALLAIGGCKGPASVQAANAKVQVFHQRLDAGDYAAIWRDSGPGIREAATEQAFTQILARIHDGLGKVRESRQVGWHAEAGTSGSSQELTMKTTFERGGGTETFIYRGSGAAQKLAGYHFSR